MNEIGKAMAECFVKHQTKEVGNYKFEFVSTDGRGVQWVKIKVYMNGTLLFSPSMNVYADHILHPEKLYKRCEEWLGWVVLKTLAKNSELEGTDLYDYLSSKCVEEGISLDVLDKHSEDIFTK